MVTVLYLMYAIGFPLYEYVKPLQFHPFALQRSMTCFVLGRPRRDLPTYSLLTSILSREGAMGNH